MGGAIFLIGVSIFMAVASFLAGVLPLSSLLSQSHIRAMSSLGVGVLVGTSLVVIIPEGVEAVAASAAYLPLHVPPSSNPEPAPSPHKKRGGWMASLFSQDFLVGKRSADDGRREFSGEGIGHDTFAGDTTAKTATGEGAKGRSRESFRNSGRSHLPTFEMGLSLVSGFILMLLIDRLPRHATDQLQSSPTTRHVSLDNLSSALEGDEDTERQSFVSSLVPTSGRLSHPIATTTGLVIHGAADGIAMGASAFSGSMRLGFIVFIAILIHKAPTAFGMTALLLKQGLSRRAARSHLVVFSLSSPVGALATYLFITIIGAGSPIPDTGPWWTGMLLLLSAGTFLYVAMHALTEDSHYCNVGAGVGGAGPDRPNGFSHDEGETTTGPRRRSGSGKPRVGDTLLTVAGILLPLLTQIEYYQ